MKSTNFIKLQPGFIAIVAACIFLAGCGGSSGEETQNEPIKTTDTVTLSGTAATGAPVSEAEVSAKCSDGSGFVSLVNTKLNGGYEGQVDPDALPCALRVSKSSDNILLHSLATSAGITNITPLTDMTISLASSDTPENWFNSASAFDVISTITTVKQSLLTTLKAAGFTLPSDDFDPFNQAFSIGDTADLLLDDIQKSLVASNTLESYSDLINVIKDGNQFPLTPEDNSGGSSDTAMDCFNPELYQQGTLVSMAHRITNADATVTTETTDYEVISNHASNGVQIDETLETFSEQNALISTRSSTDYYSTTINGVVIKNNSNYTIVYTDSNIPDFSGSLVGPGRLDFRLSEAAESQAFQFSVHTGDAVWSLIRTGTQTYMGKETVTVPAGEFTTCRFDFDYVDIGTFHPDYENTVPTPVSISQWYAQGSGVLLKSTQLDGDTRELLSASINNEDI